MKEILLTRHGQAFANKRDFTAFGNVESPLTERGIEQSTGLNRTFKTEFGIVPEEYGQPVAASEYTRPQQTARYAGFKFIDVLPLINESDVDREVLSGTDVISRHRTERWVPDETKERARELFDRIREGDLKYDIYFTHGMFIAGFLLECEARRVEVGYPFTEERGYVPLQASIIKVTL
jgi:broad specificity phosphatase PhoE